jgi:hypothetical protein
LDWPLGLEDASCGTVDERVIEDTEAVAMSLDEVDIETEGDKDDFIDIADVEDENGVWFAIAGEHPASIIKHVTRALIRNKGL